MSLLVFSGVRQVKCDKCDFTCVLKKQLVSHMRTHTGDKPYKCDLCPYAAAWRVQVLDPQYFANLFITAFH